MRKIVQKNEVSIMKLSARRSLCLECRILHHLSQSFCVTEIKTIVLEKASTISTVNFLSFQDGQKNDFQLLFYPVRFGIFKLFLIMTKFTFIWEKNNRNHIISRDPCRSPKQRQSHWSLLHHSL
jgi:hypothetical protein